MNKYSHHQQRHNSHSQHFNYNIKITYNWINQGIYEVM